MSAFIDATGRTFGRWQVLGRADNDGHRVLWWCRCACGTTRAVRAGNLLGGVSTSCGCRQREVARSQAIDNPAYGSLHSRLARRLGPASDHTCPCGADAAVWAYDHTDPNPRHATIRDGRGRPITVDYSTDTDRYRAMCRRCARFSDLGAKWAIHQPPPVHHHEAAGHAPEPADRVRRRDGGGQPTCQWTGHHPRPRYVA